MEMPSEALMAGSVDYGLMLFPRTIRASADVPVPADGKDLESIHRFMKSLELRSPKRLMNEAKRIVDGGAELLESHLPRFTENVGIPDAIPAKGKDRLQERRPGLGRVRKRAPFSLRISNSQPTVSLEPTLNIENLQDPDEFFNAYERMENANKEIEKQLRGNVDSIKHYKPSTVARRRREGILGRSYNYKHRYSSEPSDSDMLILSPEMIDQNVTITPKDKSQGKLVHQEPIPDIDLEEVELAASMEKKEIGVSGILEELLSCNNEDLEGDGALNLLQERLKIKPLDLENLCTTELHSVRRTNPFTNAECALGNTSTPTVTECLQKHHNSSTVTGSVLKILSQKSKDVDQVSNPLNPASPTPPRSPFASISSLQKRILQPYPLRDPFSPTDADLSECQNASLQLKNKLLGQVEPLKHLGSSKELESCLEVDNREPVVSNMDAQNEIGNDDHLLQQFAGGNAGIKDKSVEFWPNEKSVNIEETMNIDQCNDLFECQNATSAQPKNNLLDQVQPTKDLSSNNELESNAEVDNREPVVSNMDAQNEMANKDCLPDEFVDDNASLTSKSVEFRSNETSDNIEVTMNIDQDNSKPSGPVNVGRDDISSRKQIDRKKQLEVHTSKPPRESKVAGHKRIRKVHPMRKSLAAYGTSFESGVRRSKRIKMRPLEYWKGERFLYGRVNDSLKLIGVKYISPGKENDKLKVKPYIPADSSEYKELLELAARH